MYYVIILHDGARYQYRKNSTLHIICTSVYSAGIPGFISIFWQEVKFDRDDKFTCRLAVEKWTKKGSGSWSQWYNFHLERPLNIERNLDTYRNSS